MPITPDPEHDQQRDGSRPAIQPDFDHGTVEDQPHDVLIGQIALLPSLPGCARLAPGAAHRILADPAGEQGLERPAHPPGVDPGEVDLGDQQLGAPAQTLVGRQQLAAPFTLTSIVVRQPRPWHRQHQRPERRVESTVAVAVAMPRGGRTSLVSAPAERRLELLLQELLDEHTHLPAHRVFQRVEPVGVQTAQWRRRRGRRSFLHGVGSSSARPSEPTPPLQISTTSATRPEPWPP